MAMSLDELQARYDRLLRIRARWVARYDAAPDGSHEKHVATQQLDEVGAQVVRIEQRIAARLEVDKGTSG